VVQIPVNRQSLTEVIVGNCEPTTQNSLAVERPCQRNARLEIVFVPVVHGLPAINRAGSVNNDWINKVRASFTCCNPLRKILAKWNCGLDFETLRLIYGPFEAVTQSECESKILPDL